MIYGNILHKHEEDEMTRVLWEVSACRGRVGLDMLGQRQLLVKALKA